MFFDSVNFCTDPGEIQYPNRTEADSPNTRGDIILPGISLNYSCAQGYYIANNTDTITCLAAEPGLPARWSSAKPTVTVSISVTCSDPNSKCLTYKCEIQI